MTRYTDTNIIRALKRGAITITPAPTPDTIQPASVDLHLGHKIIANPNPAPGKKPITRNIPNDNSYPLLPGEFVLIHTEETITLSNNIAATILNKSSRARTGLSITNDGGYIDPGYNGQITLAAVNNSPEVINLTPGMKIAQIIFDQTLDPATRPYGHPTRNSHYQNSQGAVGDQS